MLCEISLALKTYFWIVISIFAHAFLVASLWLSVTSSVVDYDNEILDLTLSPLTLGDASLGKSPAVSAPKAKSIAHSAKASSTAIANQNVKSSDNDLADSAQSDPGASAVTGTSEGSGEGAFGWKDVSQLPKVIKEVKATYPAEAKAAQVAGAVIMDIVIDREGKVREVTLIKGPGHGLDESAAEALKGFQFAPAYKEEKPVAVKIRYTYRFKLDVN